MNKKLIRLTESDLHRIVKESVNNVLTELDNEVYQICYTHGFNVNTHVNKDGVYCAIFNADGNDPRIQEAIGLLKKLGLRKREGGPLSGYVHYFTIDFH